MLWQNPETGLAQKGGKRSRVLGYVASQGPGGKGRERREKDLGFRLKRQGIDLRKVPLSASAGLRGVPRHNA
jgi:hypothetical protein